MAEPIATTPPTPAGPPATPDEGSANAKPVGAGSPVLPAVAKTAPTATGAAPSSEGGGGTSDTPAWLPERLARNRQQVEAETRAKLMQELGIEDPEKFKAEREATRTEFERLKKEADERKRAEMTETERMKADIEAAKAEAEKYKTELENAKTQALVDAQDRVIESISVKYVKPAYTDFVHAKVVKHAKALDENTRANFDEKALDKFVRELVKDHPEIAASKQVVKRPAGAPPIPPSGKPVDTSKPGSLPNGKTFKPGAPNSATRAEVKAEYKRRGLSVG
jgi:hypothetical protein